MANRLAELCTLLIDNAYGDLAAQIFSSLAIHGRQTLRSMQQLTRLPLRELKTGLGILVQHHILLYYCQDVEDEDEPTFYEINWNIAYSLLRARKITKLVSDREGDVAGHLVSNVLQLGHASIGDLAAELELTPASKRDSAIDTVEDHVTEEGMLNGIAKSGLPDGALGKIATVSELHSLTRTLLKKGYLVKVGPRSYIPEADLQEEMKQTIIAEEFPDGKISGAKKGPLYQTAFNTLKRKYEDEDAYNPTIDDASHGTIKKAKRAKLNGDIPNGAHHDCGDANHSGPRLPDDMVLRVDFDQCSILLRNLKLESMANHFLGPVTGAVYGAVLRSLEDSIKLRPERTDAKEDIDYSDDDEEDRFPSVSDAKVLEYIDPSLDLSSTIKRHDPHSLPNGTNLTKRQALSSDPDEAALGIKREVDSDDEHSNLDPALAAIKARNKRLQLLTAHLELLAEHPRAFVLRPEGRHESHLDISTLTDQLLERELDTMIIARFGKHAVRVIRILRDKGKLDENQISTFAMLSIKDVRKVLTGLQYAGVLDIQEIPRDAARQASKNLYLFSFNQESVVSLILQDTYRTMTRLMQRMNIERKGYTGALAKLEETEGHEKLFTPSDLKLVDKWRQLEERFEAQVQRCDDVVAMLRDFGGATVPLR